MGFSFQDDDFGSTEVRTDGNGGDGGGTDVAPDYDYDLHENVCIDLVNYSRSCIALNEAQFVAVTLGYISGLMEDPGHYISGVIIGTSSSGKTHLQDQVEELFPDKWLYQTTTGSEKSIIYDDEWDDPEKCIASLDELNKPSDELIEVLKSLHGDDEEFNYKVTAGNAHQGANRGVDSIQREAMPYWFLYAQYNPEFELWNRLLKVPVHEGRAKNKAVSKLQADHHNIEFEGSDYTYDYEFSEGKQAIQHHIKTLPQNAWVKLPAGEDEYDGFDVHATMADIFDFGRSEVNRVSAMVFNLVRASALLNHQNRTQKEIHVPNEGIKSAIIAEPEDVANVLALRDVLLASTHELDRKKKAICSAIDAKGGGNNMATIPDIMEHIRRGNAPIISRTQVEHNLKQLREHYLVEKFEGASEEGLNMYKFQGWHKVAKISIDDEFEETFAGLTNPITGDDFVESIAEQNQELMPSASDFMDQPGVSSNAQATGKAGQATLGGASAGVELEPHEEAVYEAMADAVDGATVENMDEHDPSLYELCGVLELGDTSMNPDIEDTVFDPSHPAWNHRGVNSEWVTDADEAFDAVDEVVTELHKKGVFEMEVHDTDDMGQPVEATLHLRDPETV